MVIGDKVKDDVSPELLLSSSLPRQHLRKALGGAPVLVNNADAKVAHIENALRNTFLERQNIANFTAVGIKKDATSPTAQNSKDLKLPNIVSYKNTKLDDIASQNKEPTRDANKEPVLHHAEVIPPILTKS